MTASSLDGGQLVASGALDARLVSQSVETQLCEELVALLDGQLTHADLAHRVCARKRFGQAIAKVVALGADVACQEGLRDGNHNRLFVIKSSIWAAGRCGRVGEGRGQQYWYVAAIRRRR